MGMGEDERMMMTPPKTGLRRAPRRLVDRRAAPFALLAAALDLDLEFFSQSPLPTYSLHLPDQAARSSSRSLILIPAVSSKGH